MKLLFIFGLLLTLLTSKSHATVGVITDILKVQSEALSKTANKNADLLAKNLEAQIVNLYELDDIPIYSQADNKMLLKTVDSIYEHELFASRSGLTSALSGISEFTSDINHIQDIYKNASILYKSAAGLTKLSKQAYKLVKIGGTPEKLKLRAKILSNLLEFGSGNRNAYYRLKSNYNNFLIDQSQFVEFGAYLANTLPLFESNLEDEKSPIKAVNAINGIIELMKGEVSNEVLENLRREEWAKLVIQDFVVGKWRDEGKSFSHMKAYVKDESCEGLLNFSACSVWGYSHTVADLYEADISDESVDLIYAFSNITTLSLLAKQPNTYVVELPEYILNHSEHGVPTSIKYNAYGDNVLTTYGAHISSELMVGESDNVKSFIIDLTNIESSLALDVQISYENKETLIGEDYLQYFTQLTSLSVSAISESPATEGLSVDIKACGGEIYNTSFYYKNTSQTNWQSTLLFLGDGISSDDGTCSTYSVDIDAWEVSRYTSSNKNINFYFAAANLTSTTQSVFLVNSSDTDNDGMHDESCENEFFGDLSRNANDDEDEDGVSNLNECNNRTDPTKAGNAGILSSVSIDTVAFSDGSTSCSLNDSYWSNVSIKCSLTLDHDVAISGDLDLKTNINLNGFNLTIDGNLIQSGGTVSATDGELLINGNVTQSGGTLNVLGGNISIGGDYRIQRLTDEPDVYTYGSGRLSMTVPNGHITINGNFYVDTAAGRAAFENPLTAGLFELKGDFTFLSTASYDNSFSNYGFYTSGTHKVLLSGDSEQKIYFDDINKSSFNVLEIVNDSELGVVWLSEYNSNELITNGIPLSGMKVNMKTLRLSESTTIAGNLEVTSGHIELNGFDLSVTGNLIQSGGTVSSTDGELLINGNVTQSGGTLNVLGGNISIGGDYRIQQLTDEPDVYTYGSGRLSMTVPNGHITINGNFYVDTAAGRAAFENPLTAGLFELKGDFTFLSTASYDNSFSNYGFYTSGTHKVLLSGDSEQKIYFDDINKSSFNVLEIVNDSIVIFDTSLVVKKLFNHNQLTFMLNNNSSFPDFDGDGYKDNVDTFPLDAERFQLDTDGDGLANNVDLDDDGDGIPDVWELTYGLEPTDASDADTDLDQDGLSNFEEFLAGTLPNNNDSDDDGIKDSDDSKPTVADNNSGISSLQLANYRDALLSPKEGDRLVQDQPFRVTWSTSQIGGNYVAMYVLHDNPEGIDVDSGFDVEVIKSRNWYKFAVDMPNNGDIGFDAGLLNGIGNTYKVLLISDSGEWTVHGGTFEINESESANNSTEIYSLDLTNYRDALLSPQQGDEFTQTQNFNVSWAANNILGDKVNLYVLQDNAIGIDTDAGFDVEEIKKHKWYNFAVDVANNGDISFDAALLKSIGNSHKVLLVADSGEWTMHEGTFTVGLAKLKFTAEWLQGKTLYNIYPDSDDGDNDGKIDDYGAVTFAFTNSTALYSEGLVDTVTGTSTDYIIDDNGFIISVLAENDGTHLIRLMSPIESDPLRLCWTTLNNEKKIDVNSALTDEVKNEITDSLMDEHCINSDEYFYIDKSAAEIKLLGIDDSNNGDDSEEPLLLDNYRDALLSPQKGSQLYVGQPFKVTWDASKFNTTTVSLYVLADSPDGIDIDDGFNMDLINDPNWYNFAVDVPNNGNIGFDANILKGTGDSYKILLRADSDEWTIHRGTFTVNKAIVDSDNDTVPDSIDNCSAIANSDQLNTDGTNDGGDACDSDDDNDGELDASDAFPLDSGESVDTDGDGIGNNADTDDDDDGILDDDDSAPLDNTVGDEQAPEFAAIIDVTIEATGENTTVMLIPPSATDNIINGLEVTSDHNNAPLAVGTHTITWTAKDLSGNASTVTQLVHVVDTTPPEFSVQASETINARGLLTNVASDINAVATDLVDGEVLAGIIGDTLYPSGIHNIQLLAKDISGNETQANIVIQVNPYVELGQNAEVEAGILYRVPVTLSGTAPVYPVKVSYQAVGAFSGSTSGELVINSGTSQSIELRISETALAGESVTLSLISANNAVLLNTQSVILTVTDVNLSPTVGLSVTQGDKPISLIDAKGGVVTVTVDDLNQADTHTITWSAGNSPFADLGNDGVDNTFEFAPLLLTSGTYDLSVKVTENNTAESFEVSVNTSLQVETALGELSNDTDTDNDGISDADEGYADTDNDGIADYLDDDDNPSRLPIGENIRPMQTINGLSLSLGDVARSANGMLSGSASIDVGDIAGADETNQPIMDNTVDSHFDTLSTIVNFNVSGLSSVGETVPVVIPLADNKFIPEGAVYRKYTVAAGWFNFVVNANNSVSSALKDSDGNCPTPLSAGYTVGLSVGDNCLQLLIEDGGANDADGLANGLVEDPGVLATEVPNNPPQISLPPSLSVKEKEILTIDASNTQDAEDDELTYSWKQLSGESVELDGQETEQLSFESPSVASDEVLTFELTVNDGRDTSIVTIDVMVGDVNEAPVISIEHTVTAFEENTEVSLSSNSTDADDDSLTYLWEQVSGPSANLNDATSSTISFTAPEVESEQTLEFKLTVSDGLAQAEATTSIQVKKASSSGGAMAWLILITLITIARKLNVVKLQRDL